MIRLIWAIDAAGSIGLVLVLQGPEFQTSRLLFACMGAFSGFMCARRR